MRGLCADCASPPWSRAEGRHHPPLRLTGRYCEAMVRALPALDTPCSAFHGEHGIIDEYRLAARPSFTGEDVLGLPGRDR
ncbi:hypothetical protein DSL92_02420 [Billgrantia gudaonensis]|uniref:Uncharacterized protein n=1 Tax=Billgrantia gudaonensis TaxID=376427 RepID=A0A3S0NHL7_9GAMM|nr:hypothetical protein DSL92_02420 [Halomonas gudaonensis]